MLEYGKCEIGDVGSPTLALSAARDDENASRSSQDALGRVSRKK